MMFASLGGCRGQAPHPTERPLAAAPELQSSATTVGLFDLGHALSQVSCRKLLGCCRPAEVVDRLGGAASDPQSCQHLQDPRYVAYVQRLSQSHVQGRIAYDGARAKRCIAALEAMSCAQYARQGYLGPTPNSDCDLWLQPRVAAGGACSDDNQCATGYCQGREVDSDATLQDGVCGAKPAVGEHCSGVCAAGTTCDWSQSPALCVPAHAAGESCQDNNACLSQICEMGTCRDAPSSCAGQ